MKKIIAVELYSDERDFILDLLEYALLDDLIATLKNAKPNKHEILNLNLSEYDLEQLIGNLSLEANHNKKRMIQDTACELAEKLEAYEFQLRKQTAH